MLRSPFPTIPTDVNKVIYGGRTLIDLTEDTVSASTLLLDVQAHNKRGMKIRGTYVAPITYATGSQASVKVAGYETKTITLTTVTFTPVLVELFMKGNGATGDVNLICARRLPNGTSQYVESKYYRGISPKIVVSGKNVQVKLYNNDNTYADSGVINWQVVGYE